VNVSLLEVVIALGVVSIVFTLSGTSRDTWMKHDIMSSKHLYFHQLQSAKQQSYQRNIDQLISLNGTTIGYNSFGRTKYAGTLKKHSSSLVSLGIGAGKISIK